MKLKQKYLHTGGAVPQEFQFDNIIPPSMLSKPVYACTAKSCVCARRSWGHAKGCEQALVHTGHMWGSRGCTPGQGCPHVLARVLGHHLTHVQRMSNTSGTRLDMQHIGGGGEDDGVSVGGGDCISGRLRSSHRPSGRVHE